MRTFARILINLAFLAGTAAALGAAVASKAYKHASHDTRIAVPVVIVAAGFILACLLLRAIPSRAQLAQRKKAQRPSSPYAAPSGRK